MKARSPYADLPGKAFWRTGVVDQSPLRPKDLYTRKFRIDKDARIVAAGSCFAQHISRHLKRNGFAVVDVEPAPEHLPAELHHRYGYSMYSGRFGNIYTMRQLLQLAQEAFGTRAPGEVVWTKGGAYYDALRPSVEPDGLASAEEVLIHRKHHVRKVRDMFLNAEVMIFTLGLTEAWVHKDSGTVFPTVPGLIAGEFSSDAYEFRNFEFAEILADFNAFRELIRSSRPEPKPVNFLLTVSPVPLTATNSGDHVLSATTYSKSVLRSVAGQLAKNHADIDYFPSFEIINNCWSRGIFYENNMRSVAAEGVEVAMTTFLREHGVDVGAAPEARAGAPQAPTAAATEAISAAEQSDDLVCEELLLEAFVK
ncbi:MAG: GSCFA domain-containing protein [Caldimonas sp.]